NLAEVFGPKSELAVKAVSAFADALEYWSTKPRVRAFYNEWRRLFGIVYGEQFTTHQAEEVKKLSDMYKVGRDTDFQELLFSVHTYFVFLMKLIAAELLTISETSFKSSFSHNLAHADKETLIAKLEEIENGGVYAKRGITNFLEGDFFRWYLDAFSPRLEEAIREIARAFSDFEPATTIINPDSTRDLLKKLYQYLVPQEVRHKLGEFYTPDWLAELVLNEVGYNGDTLKRFIDPTCGSGTFVVLAIYRAKENGRTNKIHNRETAKRIVANIWGFDLNPLAIIAARTNYIFALGELVDELESFEIPIYLADSVLWPQSYGQLELAPQGDAVDVKTSVGTFYVPSIWVKDNGFLLRLAAPLVEEMAKHHYKPEEALVRFSEKGLVFPPHEAVVKQFYNHILELEKEEKNGIWARFLKNAFAPMVAGEFDFVVGNPPWIRWGYLSQEYRQATLPMWKSYGLFSLKGHAARLGGGEKDFSMLITYAAIDYYLKKHGKLGFLITQEVFKSKGAGEGFRRFNLSSEKPKLFKVFKAHDLVQVQPFEGAANKTAAIFVKKGEETTYPVPYTVWTRKKGVGKIPTDAMLEDVLPMLKKKKLQAIPIGKNIGAWQTMSLGQQELRNIEGKNQYQARRGASTEPYGIFWLNIKQVLSDNDIIIQNLYDRGKWEIKSVEEVIESDLVHPAISGGDIERWSIVSINYVLVTQEPKTRIGYEETIFKARWPRTFGYLLKFKNELIERAAFKKYHAEQNNPFWSQYNIAEYSFARYKVVWKRMANDIVATVVSQYKTPFGYKTIIATDTTSLFAFDNENDAHYVCAIINSTLVRSFIKSYSSAGRGFGAPSVMEHVGVPKFNPQNKLHQDLSKSSKTLHELKSKGETENIIELEKKNDELV
ncbi:MAG: N-6 DNA methylase, partial [Bacteroidota bacterium]